MRILILSILTLFVLSTWANETEKLPLRTLQLNSTFEFSTTGLNLKFGKDNWFQNGRYLGDDKSAIDKAQPACYINAFDFENDEPTYPKQIQLVLKEVSGRIDEVDYGTSLVFSFREPSSAFAAHCYRAFNGEISEMTISEIKKVFGEYLVSKIIKVDTLPELNPKRTPLTSDFIKNHLKIVAKNSLPLNFLKNSSAFYTVFIQGGVIVPTMPPFNPETPYCELTYRADKYSGESIEVPAGTEFTPSDWYMMVEKGEREGKNLATNFSISIKLDQKGRYQLLCRNDSLLRVIDFQDLLAATGNLIEWQAKHDFTGVLGM